jgi:hypothetical protein
METGRNGAPCLDANQTARKKGRSRTSKEVRVRARRKAFRFVSAFIPHGVRARRVYIHECFFRMEPETVRVDEKGTSEVGIAVTAKAPPARKARGVVSSDNADPGNRVKQSTMSFRALNRRGHVHQSRQRLIAAPTSPYGSRQRELHWVSSALHHPA